MTLPDLHLLKSLTDPALLARTESLAREERRITVELLHHLREIESRMLYAERFASLHEYLTKGLLYSDGAAQRRIQAMRAMKEVPELEAAIQDGRLNLTTASQVQVFLSQERRNERDYSREEKKELFTQVEGLSKRETEKLLVAISPESALTPDREREVAPGRTQITFTADDELMAMLQRVRELDSHREPNPDYLALFKRMAELTLQKLDPERRGVKARAKGMTPTPPAEWNEMNRSAISAPRGRLIPAAVQRALWSRDGGCCQHRDSITKRLCGSRFQVQADHVIAFADGGSHALENLQLRCATHNRLRAVKRFGRAKMSQYLPLLAKESRPAGACELTADNIRSF